MHFEEEKDGDLFPIFDVSILVTILKQNNPPPPVWICTVTQSRISLATVASTLELQNIKTEHCKCIPNKMPYDSRPSFGVLTLTFQHIMTEILPFSRLKIDGKN
jgi:hypothetical protein